MNEGWVCPSCKRNNNPIVMTCPCTYSKGEHYQNPPWQPAKENTSPYCYICGQYLCSGFTHRCPGPGATTAVSTVTGYTCAMCGCFISYSAQQHVCISYK